MKAWLINLILPIIEKNLADEIAIALRDRIAPSNTVTPEFGAMVMASFEALPAPE